MSADAKKVLLVVDDSNRLSPEEVAAAVVITQQETSAAEAKRTHWLSFVTTLVLQEREAALSSKERNRPCKCGSGRKAKKCIGSHAMSGAEQQRIDEVMARRLENRDPQQALRLLTLLGFVTTPPALR